MRLVPILLAGVLSACGSPAPQYSGTVQTESVAVGSQVGGRVIEVPVAAGQTVKAGTVIARLDPAMLQANLDQAVASAHAAQANLQALQSGSLVSQVAQARGASESSSATYTQTLTAGSHRVVAARAALANARAGETLAEREFERRSSLAASGDVSQESLDQARAARDQARAATREAKAQYEQLIRADLPGETSAARANAGAARTSYAATSQATADQIAQAQAQERDAEAAVAYAEARLREATIVTPAAGVIASLNLHPGDMLSENQTAAIVDTFKDPYAYIYASQEDLARLQAAKQLHVTSDTGSGTYEATVEAFDRSAQFTPQNTETADTRAVLVYGVKIRIHDPKHELLDGTTVTVAAP
jgi:HlyD family secretion protein